MELCQCGHIVNKGAKIMGEAARIVGACCVMPRANGHTTAAVVDEILKRFSNPVMCHGNLREIIFTPITMNTFGYHTVDWYDKRHGGKL